MATYQVTCRYRQDNGMLYSMPTLKDTVTVQANSISAARQAAFAAMYAKYRPHCSHVCIVTVEEKAE